MGCRLTPDILVGPQLDARARLLRIEDTRRDEPALMDSLLRSADPVTRGAAALAAGRIGARRHAPVLRQLATDADSAVAAKAIFALGLLEDTASVGIAAIALRGDTARGREAAWLLGTLGERGRAAIVAGLSDRSLPATTRGGLLLAAARLRPVPATTVAPLLASEDSALAWRAAYVIARGRGVAALRALLGQRNAGWSSVREQVARGAARSMAGDSLGALAREALRGLLADHEARVRVNTVRSLASYGPAERTAVLSALRDPDANVRVVAAQSLDAVLDSSTATWRDAFGSDTTFAVRRAVADGAARHGVDV
ncbi:MAG: HEAT repeat domain-containing protein, partial [bacterium]